MPESVNLVSPQIYVEEIDQTVYNAEVEGPVGAIILRNTWKGRENDTVLVANENELISTFGKPTTYAPCFCDMFTAIGFLKEANSLYCTRIMPDTARFAGTKATLATSATFTAFTSANSYGLGDGVSEISDPDLFADEVAVPDPYVLYAIAAYRGNSGNYLRVAVCDKTHYDQIRKKTITGWDTFAAISAVDSPLDTNYEFLILVQECEQGTDTTVEANWSFVEAWNVSTQENKLDDLGRNMFVENRINDNSKYIRVSLNSTYLNTALTTFATAEWQTLGGGCNTKTAGVGPTGDEDPGTTITDAAVNLYANSESTLVDLFLDGNKSTATKQTIAGVVNARKDCMFIMDCPSASVVSNIGSEATDLITWIDGLYTTDADFDSSYVAAYGNWLDIRDKYANKYRWVPASGYVGAVFARCQNNFEFWTAPAGLNVGNISGIRRLAWNPSLANRDDVYRFGINSIVSFAGSGKYVFGQKTLLNKDSAFNRINVRRLFLSVEKDISTLSRYYLFGPNTPSRRLQYTNEIAYVLDKAKGREGIDDYKIVCDDTNNTATTIAKGELRADIWIIPVYAVEYVRLTFIASKTGTSFTETT